MNSKMTTEYLNNSAWYRAVKVVYILAFLAISTLIWVIFLEYKVLDIPNSKIVCQYGNERQFLVKEVFSKDELPTVLPDYYRSADSQFSEKVLQVCEITKIVTRSEQPAGFVPDPYRVETKDKTQFGYLLLALVIAAIIFEVIRRIFYYIVLGTMNPKK